MLRQPRARLVADPTVGVGDLAQPLEKFAAEEQEPNIHKLLSPPASASWKSGCPTSWLASLNPLFKSYVEVAPNTIISSKKHRQAIVRLLENKKIVNTTRKTSEDFADIIDDIVRMGLSHFRILRQHSEKKEQAFRKCDQNQQQALEAVLALINIDAAAETQLALIQPQPAQAEDSQTSQDTPGPSPTPLPSASSGTKQFETRATAAESSKRSLESIFDSILDQHDEDEEKEIEITYLKQSAGRQSTFERQTRDEAYEDSPQRKNMFALQMSPEEEELLKSAAQGQPISRDGKSQNQRLNANAPKKAKGNSKGKAKKTIQKSKSGGKGSKTQDNEEDEPDMVPLKRPSAATSTLADEEDEEVLKTYIPDNTVELAMKRAHELSPEEFTREVRRQRTTSNAYHRCETVLMKGGFTKLDAQAVGRLAGRMAGAEFDQAWPLAKAKAKAKTKAKSKPQAKAAAASPAESTALPKHPKVAKTMKKRKQRKKKKTGAKAIIDQEMTMDTEDGTATSPKDVD